MRFIDIVIELGLSVACNGHEDATQRVSKNLVGAQYGLWQSWGSFVIE